MDKVIYGILLFGAGFAIVMQISMLAILLAGVMACYAIWTDSRDSRRKNGKHHARAVGRIARKL